MSQSLAPLPDAAVKEIRALGDYARAEFPEAFARLVEKRDQMGQRWRGERRDLTWVALYRHPEGLTVRDVTRAAGVEQVRPVLDELHRAGYAEIVAGERHQVWRLTPLGLSAPIGWTRS